MYALITGASSGIGKEIAVLLAQKGYHLILVARRKDRLEKLKKALMKRYSVEVISKECDLSVQKNCYKLHEEFKDYNITILINSAGYGKVGFSENIPLEEEINMIHTNILSLHILTKLFVSSMKKGRILNISSIAGFQPGPMLTVYSATKAYVTSFSIALNYELKKQMKNIHITTLCPGPVDTEFDQVAGTNFSLHSISAKKCARIALKGLFHNKDLVIPGLSMKALHLAGKYSPYQFLLPMEYAIQTKKL